VDAWRAVQADLGLKGTVETINRQDVLTWGQRHRSLDQPLCRWLLPSLAPAI
jgi:hypothetical protein